MNKSLTAIFFSVLFLCSSLAAHADKNSNAPQQENKWITEVRNYKHAFLIKETGMTEAQQKEFIPLYTEMEDKVYSTNREARNLEQQLSSSQYPRSYPLLRQNFLFRYPTKSNIQANM